MISACAEMKAVNKRVGFVLDSDAKVCCSNPPETEEINKKRGGLDFESKTFTTMVGVTASKSNVTCAKPIDRECREIYTHWNAEMCVRYGGNKRES